MRENRVRVQDFGVVPAGDARLVPIPSVPGKNCKLHHLAAAAFARMAQACADEIGIKIVAASGWRPHRWQDRAEYEEYLISHYKTVAAGRRWVAFDSPHETGLAVDIGSGGLEPKSATAAEQKTTALYAWLTKRAADFGFTPYLPEPWHWEFNCGVAAWSK